MKFIIIKIVLLLLISRCAKNEIKVIDIEKVFSALKEGRTTLDQLEFDLSDCLYLDSSLKYSIESLEPTYFAGREFKLSKYQFDSEDGEEILLSSDYKSVNDLVIAPDKHFKKYLIDEFGLKYHKDEIPDAVLVYGEKAFIRFSNEFSSSRYIIELIEPNKINIVDPLLRTALG